MSRLECEQAVRTHVGCRRKLNEDALLADSSRGVWVVADGMGGHDAGEVASAAVIEAVAACAGEGSLAERAAVTATALVEVNARLMELAKAGKEPRTIGSTVVVLLAEPGRFACLWAGDSRAYRLRDGQLEQLTRDHSLVQELVDAGMLDATEADNHPNANIITRAVGAAPELEIAQSTGDLRAGDLFLLASDGVTRLLNRNELAQEAGSPDLEAAADRMIATVLERGAPDNATLILIRAL